MIKNIIKRLSLPVIVSIFLGTLVSTTIYASNSNQIDDAVFYNHTSMSEQQISNFINSFPKSCLIGGNYPSGLSPITFQEPQSYSNYGNTTSPARIIWVTSQLYKINPQVLLATLEKEQNLITGNAGCGTWRYNSAMGYNCPDGSENSLKDYPNIGIYRTCVAKESNAGFSRQVNHAGWQLSFDGKRANGELGWMGDGATTYYGRMTQGYRARVNGGAAAYYDGYTNINGQSVYLENGATAALYNYTPHFSNFERIFTLWFGSPFITNKYLATYHSQGQFPTISQGQSSNITLRFKNSGNLTWYDSATAGTAQVPPVVLATMRPTNRCSSFTATSWYSCNRPTGLFSKVYEADGTTLASNQHMAAPGQVVEYNIVVTSPSDANILPGTYDEYFAPIREGAGADWYMGVDHVFMRITVNNAYSAAYAGQSAYPTILQNDRKEAFVRFKNTGIATWYDSVSAPGQNTQPVVLATDGPVNRKSGLGSAWPNSARPTTTFSKVYEADGTTLASNQHMAAPGQVVEYRFLLTPTMYTQPNLYREYFQLIREGAYSWSVANSGAHLDVTVSRAEYSATYSSQSTYQTVNRGDSSQIHFVLKNTGKNSWYDDNAWTPGILPVHFASTDPINRSSPFTTPSWTNSARPLTTFSRVYEADGTTLASNQHVVLPGQYARFEFPVKAPTSIGTYREAFLPIVEGAPGYSWYMGGGVWQNITVQ